MAIGIGLTDIGLVRTAGAFLNPAGSFTFMTWAAFPTAVSSGYRILNLLGDRTYAGAYVRTGPNRSDSTDWQLKAQNAAATNAATNEIIYQTPTIWHHIAVTYVTGTNVLSIYYNGTLKDTITVNLSLSTFSREQIGWDVSPSSHGNLYVCCYRSWSAALTADQIRAEMASENAVLAAGLFCDTPLSTLSDLADDSGNGRNWTAQGTLTTVTGPLLGDASITNTSAAAAEEVPTLPTTICRSVRDATTNTVWFKLTYSGASVTVGSSSFGALSGGYVARQRVYDGLANAVAGTLYRDLSTGNTFQVPLAVPAFAGHVYYFKIEPNSASQDPAVLVFSLLSEIPQTAPVGSIAVNDDTDGFPLALLDAETGQVLRTIPDFPAGEDGHLLPDGRLLVHSIGTIAGGVGLFAYDDQFVLLAGPLTVSFAAIRITSNRSNLFYVGAYTGGQWLVTTISPNSWEQGATTWELDPGDPGAADLIAIAVSLDNSTLYYAPGGSAEGRIARWDLTNDLTLSDLAAAFGGGYTLAMGGLGAAGSGDILVLPDTSIVVGYTNGVNSKLRHYAANGTVLATYTYSNLLQHITHDGSNTDTVWLWFVNASDLGSSIFSKIDLTDGSVVQTTPSIVQYNRGEYNLPTTPDPSERFGHSPSCPFWMLAVAYDGDGDDGGDGDGFSYNVVERPIRRLRRAPHLNNEHKRIFYPGLELDLDRGIGTVTGQGADPLIMVRMSRDGGRTWGNEMKMRAGELGQYRVRAELYRLGYARDAVFEVSVSDPNDWRLVNAWLTPDPEAGLD